MGHSKWGDIKKRRAGAKLAAHQERLQRSLAVLEKSRAKWAGLADERVPRDELLRRLRAQHEVIKITGENLDHSEDERLHLAKALDVADATKKRFELEVEEMRGKLHYMATANAKLSNPPSPVPLLLWCPACHARHVDLGEWAEREHRTHECDACGMRWAPASVATVGVQKLPNADDAARALFTATPQELGDAALSGAAKKAAKP